MLEVNVGVRELALFVHRRGDIHYRYDRSTSAEEGISAQRRYQKSRYPIGPAQQEHACEGYQREYAVSETITTEGVRVTVGGRIDGCDLGAHLVEEIKTTRADIDGLHAHIGNVHIAQLKLYGALLPAATWHLRLVYLHPDHDQVTNYAFTSKTDALRRFLNDACLVYASWIVAHRERVAQRNRGLAGIAFPFEEFRDTQRRIARAVYRALRDERQLLLEAPTGTGKTVATVFPVLKALGESVIDRIVYLSSRTTGQRTAEQTLQLFEAAKPLTSVTVSARERVCFNPEVACDPAQCEYARGYYDRMPDARAALLGTGVVRRERVAEVARLHRVCPFELSLDVAAWADVVICDYNYIFDPFARLQRIKGVEHSRVGVLIDEAHQLGERARDMLTVDIDRRSIKRAIGEAPALIAKRLKSVDRAVAKVKRDDEVGVIAVPNAILRAIQRLLTTANEVGVDHNLVNLRDCIFECVAFLRGSEWFDEDDFVYLLHEDGRIEMTCVSAARHINEKLGEMHGGVRFSGTVSPLAFFQTMHGQPPSENVARTRNGFPTERLGVFIVSDLATYYRSRARTLCDLVGLINEVTAERGGNYLVAFPSFEYLEAVANHLSERSVRCQSRTMTSDDRQAFIDWMGELDGVKLGLVVMGGLFAESVDFDGEALNGVIVVSAGLPPPSKVRDLIATRHGEDGYRVAYQQPAMTRVVQAAGRVVRGGKDSGIVVLVDPRFAKEDFQTFFPSHWAPRLTSTCHVAADVRHFWRELAVHCE